MPAEPLMDWMIDDPPATEDPAVVRAYIADLRSIVPQSDDIRESIRIAEQLAAELDRERAQRAA